MDALLADLAKDIVLYEETCGRCGREVTENKLTLGSKVYHRQCFICFVCRGRLDPKHPPYEFHNQIYCETDYKIAIQKPVCAAW